MKVWVLTGDKLETAINIGFSCNLLTESHHQIIVDGVSEIEARESLIKGQNDISVAVDKQLFALIVTGDALIHCLKKEQGSAKILMEVAEQCNAVLACRVSPKQVREREQENISSTKKKKFYQILKVSSIFYFVYFF